eukprot:gene4799-biopygen15091
MKLSFNQPTYSDLRLVLRSSQGGSSTSSDDQANGSPPAKQQCTCTLDDVRSFYTHKFILASESPIINAMLLRAKELMDLQAMDAVLSITLAPVECQGAVCLLVLPPARQLTDPQLEVLELPMEQEELLACEVLCRSMYCDDLVEEVDSVLSSGQGAGVSRVTLLLQVYRLAGRLELCSDQCVRAISALCSAELDLEDGVQYVFSLKRSAPALAEHTTIKTKDPVKAASMQKMLQSVYGSSVAWFKDGRKLFAVRFTHEVSFSASCLTELLTLVQRSGAQEDLHVVRAPPGQYNGYDFFPTLSVQLQFDGSKKTFVLSVGFEAVSSVSDMSLRLSFNQPTYADLLLVLRSSKDGCSTSSDVFAIGSPLAKRQCTGLSLDDVCSFYTHKVILAAKSPTINAMLQRAKDFRDSAWLIVSPPTRQPTDPQLAVLELPMEQEELLACEAISALSSTDCASVDAINSVFALKRSAPTLAEHATIKDLMEKCLSQLVERFGVITDLMWVDSLMEEFMQLDFLSVHAFLGSDGLLVVSENEIIVLMGKWMGGDWADRMSKEELKAFWNVLRLGHLTPSFISRLAVLAPWLPVDPDVLQLATEWKMCQTRDPVKAASMQKMLQSVYGSSVAWFKNERQDDDYNDGDGCSSAFCFSASCLADLLALVQRSGAHEDLHVVRAPPVQYNGYDFFPALSAQLLSEGSTKKIVLSVGFEVRTSASLSRGGQTLVHVKASYQLYSRPAFKREVDDFVHGTHAWELTRVDTLDDFSCLGSYLNQSGKLKGSLRIDTID